MCTGIEHTLDLGMLLERLREVEGVQVLALHAKIEGLDASRE
jgi:hypothetical protein